MAKAIIDEKENLFQDMPTPEQEIKSNVIFKFTLIGIVIVIVLISSIVKGNIQFKDFFKFNYSLTLSDLSNSKEYIILFIIIMPLSICLFISNLNWEREAIGKYAEEEEKRKKTEEDKKKEEFEEKMRGVHFKAD